MSDIDNNKQQIIDEYTSKVQYFDDLRDEVNNLQRAISDMKANIKNTIDTQNRVKTANYEIWSQLEEKPATPKTTEKPQPTVADILGELLK